VSGNLATWIGGIETRGSGFLFGNGNVLSSRARHDEKLSHSNGIRTRDSPNTAIEKQNAVPFPPFNAPTIVTRFIYRFIYDGNRVDFTTGQSKPKRCVKI